MTRSRIALAGCALLLVAAAWMLLASTTVFDGRGGKLNCGNVVSRRVTLSSSNYNDCGRALNGRAGWAIGLSAVGLTGFFLLRDSERVGERTSVGT